MLNDGPRLTFLPAPMRIVYGGKTAFLEGDKGEVVFRMLKALSESPRLRLNIDLLIAGVWGRKVSRDKFYMAIRWCRRVLEEELGFPMYLVIEDNAVVLHE